MERQMTERGINRKDKHGGRWLMLWALLGSSPSFRTKGRCAARMTATNIKTQTPQENSPNTRIRAPAANMVCISNGSHLQMWSHKIIMELKIPITSWHHSPHNMAACYYLFLWASCDIGVNRTPPGRCTENTMQCTEYLIRRINGYALGLHIGWVFCY